jgi:hypothetical protein
MVESLQQHSDGPETWRYDGRPVVVVGVDSSPASRSAALAAGSAARSLGGIVVAVHVPSLSPGRPSRSAWAPARRSSRPRS